MDKGARTSQKKKMRLSYLEPGKIMKGPGEIPTLTFRKQKRNEGPFGKKWSALGGR